MLLSSLSVMISRLFMEFVIYVGFNTVIWGSNPVVSLRFCIFCSFCCSFCTRMFVILDGWSWHHLFWIEVNAWIFFKNIRVRHLTLDKAFNLLQLIIFGVIFIFGSVFKMDIFPYYSLLEFFPQSFMSLTTLSGMGKILDLNAFQNSPGVNVKNIYRTL